MKNCEHCQNLRINNCSNNSKLATATVNTTTPTIKMKIPKKTTTAATLNAATKTIAAPKVARPAAVATATTTRTATTTTVTTNQLCQHQHRHLQRCSSSSVGSICGDTVSSYSGSPTDSMLTIPTPPPNAPPANSFHYLHQHNNAGNNNGNNSNHQHIAFPSNKSKTVLPPSNAATLSANNATITQPGIEMATRAPPNKTQNVTGMLSTGAPSQTLPPVIQQHLLNSSSSSTAVTAGGLPSQQQQHLAPPPPATAATLPPLVGGLGAAAMAADLAQSFSLLHQQAYHFRDILYAAHLLGRGYYQPAGPLISHVLPPVAAGPPIPPNVPLLAATATKIKSQTPTAANTVDSNEHIPGAGQTNPTTTEPPDADVLITGGDLTHFRYPAHSTSGGTSPASAAAHHSQQQQQQHHHQLHQQAAAAAAAAAHQSSPYPRSMHAQMHYSTAYPANYYSPYPGEPMCYSPPAYQPYFPTKVYQSAPPPPPPPHHSAYRRYPYYQPGHPPPADLYEQAPPPPPVAGTAPPPSCPPPSQSGVPPPPQGGSQLVPAGPAAHTQHLEHYPGPPGYYPSYSPGGGGAGQCYTRSIQAPYMDYPPQCPCPMQQSCPKNVHTGPHIGSNSNSNSKNVNSSTSTSNSNNVTAIINHCNNNNLNVALSHTNNRNISKIISNTSNNNSSNTSSNNLIMNVGNNNINSSSSSMNSNNSSSHALTTSRGPVKNVVSTSVTNNCTNNTQTPFVEKEARKEAPKTLPLLSIAVKTEIAADDTDNKSQYEESVLTPLTPPESYTTNEDKLKDNLDKNAVTAIPLEEDIEEAIDKLQSNNPQQQRASNTRLLAIATPIEAYDLTTTTPPLQNNTLQATATATTQSTRHAVGRRARIGKSMAWNMVYAGAASQQTPTLTAFSRLQITSPTNCNIPNSAQRPALTAQNSQQHNNNKHVSVGSNITTSSATQANVTNNIITKQEMEEITTPLLLKAEIKAEKIKLEDELLDSVLQQHTSVSQLAPPSTQKHIIPDKNEVKVIKAEPVTLSEVLNESKVKIENDCEVIKMIVSKEVETDIEEQNSNTTLNKPVGRMRLLPSRQQPLISTPVSLTAVNCDIDLSNASDEEVLDLCHSPAVGSSSGKRIKILEFNKNQCKKSPPNSYKSLIKQAEPKTYLCLSRKIDKKSRFGKVHSSRSGKNNATNNSLRRRELILTDQQKQRLRLRKKKLAALEKKKRDAKEVRRAEIKERRKQAKQQQVKSKDRPLNGKHNIDKTNEAEKPSIVNLIEEEDEKIKFKSQTGRLNTSSDYTNSTPMCGKLTKSMDNSPLTTPKPSPRRGKPAKKPSIPLHVIGTVDAVSRGYFSEPELRSANVLTLPICRKDIPKAKVEEEEARKPLVIKIQKKYKTTSEKRSKSETKKPIKSSALHANEEILNLHTLTRPVLDLSSHKDSVFKQTTSKMAEDGLIKQNQCELSTKDIPKEPKVSKKLTISKKSRSNDSKSKKEGKTKKSLSNCNGKKSKSTKKSNNLESGEVNVTDAMLVIDDSRSLETLKPTSPESTCDIVETNNNEYNKVAIDKTVPSTSVVELRIEDTILSDYEEQLRDNTLSGAVEKSCKFTGQALSSSQSPLTLSENSATKEEMEQQHSSDAHSTTPVFLQPTIPPMPRVVCHSHHHQHVGKRNRSRSKFGSRKRQKLKHSTVSFELDETLPAIPRSDVVPKWNNGWTWEGEPFQGAVFLNSDDPLVIRTCYPAMRHLEGDIIRSRDCVLLKANDENELPYVAKVAHLWENPEDGEMMMSLLWYYRPEHTEQGRQPSDSSDEVYASRHRDHNSVACIEDKCYVLTFSEYCRYRRRVRAAEEDIEDVNIVPKRPNYYSIRIVPDNTNPELVMFCRRAYEFRTKRLLKMPNKQDYYVVTS